MTTTPKQDLFAHLAEAHGFEVSYRSWTYPGLRRIHLQMHRGQYQGHTSDHYHVGRGLDPVTQPEGWNDGGCPVEMPSTEWVPAMDGDEQYGWRLDLPGDRSAFVTAVSVGDGYEWSVGGVFNTYVDAEGTRATLWAAQRAAEVASA
jgi:hypothetical protein